MRFTFKFLTFLVVFAIAASFQPLYAVTQQEMEQAKTITAFWYLRFANDGAGYMEDGKMPTNMAALEKMLKETERNNLKAFRTVSVPADYASWDKKKLVEFWGTTFFNSPGLSDKGKIAKSRVRKKLEAMTVAAPAPEAPAPAAETSATENKSDDKSSSPQTNTVESAGKDAGLPEAGAIIDQALAADSTALAIEDSLASDTHKSNQKSSGTWIYIVALVILVGVVVWLVIFASKTMQQSNTPSSDDETDDSPAPRRKRAEDVVPVHVADPLPDRRAPEPIRHHENVSVSSSIIAADAMEQARTEIKSLRAECSRLNDENLRLQSALEGSRQEVEQLRERLRTVSAAMTTLTESPVQVSAAAADGVQSAEPLQPSRQAAPRPAVEEEKREIYLGRVNPRGLFVRADKRPVADKTVFVLTTKDGYTGTFRVLQVAEVIDRCLENPDHFLAGGCSAPDILATEDAEQIRTLQAGTAIFEDGCWRMIRKSKIVYE